MPYTTHGHWFGPGAPFPRWPHAVAKCGGPGLCADCRGEAAPVVQLVGDLDAANRRADNAVERQRKAEAKLAKLSARVAGLEEDTNKLRALEAAGVDNWDGYSYAMEILAERSGGSDG